LEILGIGWKWFPRRRTGYKLILAGGLILTHLINLIYSIMKNICMICFGDIMHPKNGYHIRTMMLAKKLDKNNKVNIYQFSDNDTYYDNKIQIIRK